MNEFPVYQEWTEDENGEWQSSGWLDLVNEEPLDIYENDYDITDIEYDKQGLPIEGIARLKNTYVR